MDHATIKTWMQTIEMPLKKTKFQTSNVKGLKMSNIAWLFRKESKQCYRKLQIKGRFPLTSHESWKIRTLNSSRVRSASYPTFYDIFYTDVSFYYSKESSVWSWSWQWLYTILKTHRIHLPRWMACQNHPPPPLYVHIFPDFLSIRAHRGYPQGQSVPSSVDWTSETLAQRSVNAASINCQASFNQDFKTGSFDNLQLVLSCSIQAFSAVSDICTWCTQVSDHCVLQPLKKITELLVLGHMD